MLAQFFDDGPLVFAGDGMPHDDQIEISVTKFQGLGEADGGRNLVPCRLQQHAPRVEQGRVIRYRKNARFHRSGSWMESNYNAEVNFSVCAQKEKVQFLPLAVPRLLPVPA